MLRQFELVEKVRSYDPSADEALINRAYIYAMKMHGSQLRASGDPYFSHPIQVAGILSDLKLDSESIATALLHDVVEDTEASIDDIESMFGGNVARLVDGVTKLGRLETRSEQSKDAENFRKLLLAMSQDIRVLLVKLADRLHNMQTLHFIKSAEKRQRIARETLEIYAPLAERIGMQQFRDQLEDLAFAELNAEARESILRRLEFLRGRGGEDLTHQVIAELNRTLDEEGVTAKVSGRVKSPYSIWTKMQRKNVEFEQLSDIMAFRVVVASVPECYQALGVLHGQYTVVPGRFKDYISTPKPNGYRSLHSGLIGPLGRRIEVQIRTGEMHEISEVGVAAHWSYKEGVSLDGKQYRWVRELLDILEHASNPEEFLEHTKMEMFQDQVFCFTPRGDLISLPRGATPVDFAYAVHSEVGDATVGAKVNGRMVPLRFKLENGDQVEIQTAKGQTPSPDWDAFVVSGKAKARIRRFVRLRQREQYAELGREILQKTFRKAGYDPSERALEGAVRSLKQESVEDLCIAVGQGNLTAREVMVTLHPEARDAERERQQAKSEENALKRRRAAQASSQHAVPIQGLIAGMAVHFPHCCHPLPGDRIVGIVTTGKGVTVHTIDCDVLEGFNDQPERWIDLAWEKQGQEQLFTGRLHVTINNEPGSLGNLTSVIGKAQGNILNLKITHRSLDFFEILVDIEVNDAKHLLAIIAALRATATVASVDRARA